MVKHDNEDRRRKDDGKKQERRDQPHPLTIIQGILGKPRCTLRWSRKGTPHLVYSAQDGAKISICWFGSRKSWKTFEPWPGYAGGERIDQTISEWKAEDVLGMLGYLLGPGSTIEVK